LRAPSSPGAVPGMRRAVVEFAELHGVGHPPDVALAVSEAVTNAVLHGYRDGASGDVRVVACAEPARLVVVVRDYGTGMSPHPNSPGLGLGLSVIGRLTTEMNIERPDLGGGTRLRMHFANP
jgi:anti-sigma regulatory factor (Ser/Thr protein kinase)